MNKKELKAASKDITSDYDMAEAMKFIRKSFYEKALSAELDDHLGYDNHSASDSNNTRNGYDVSTVFRTQGYTAIDCFS